MNIAVIIPARGGSKGLPRKNILPLGGKPLINWNIEAAQSSSFNPRVFVSTDDEEISATAKAAGAEVIERPADLAGDRASSESALLHALDELERSRNYHPELLVFMQCTSPLTAAEDIDQSIRLLLDENADSAFTATDFHYFIWEKDKDGAHGVNHDKRSRLLRQDRKPQYQENGAVYVMRVDGFKQAKHRFFGKTVLSEVPHERCFEIDDLMDFKVAEGLLMARRADAATGAHDGEQATVARRLKAVLFDFDGVFTDNKVQVDENGVESVRCDRSDGWGIGQLKKVGLKLAVLSTEANPVVSARCRKLGIECRQDLGDRKLEAFLAWCKDNALDPSETAYVGNDVNDLECLRACGFSVVPSDGYDTVKQVADKILTQKGGRGSVRELCDYLMEIKEKDMNE